MALVIVLTIAAIAAVGYAAVRTTKARLVSRTDGSLQSQLVTAQAAMKQLAPETLSEMERFDAVTRRESSVIVLDPAGRVTSSLPANADGHVEPLPELPNLARLRGHLGTPFGAHAADGTPYRVVAGEVDGRLTIAFATSLTTVDQTVHDLTTILLVIGGIAIALLSLILWLLLTAATKPVDEMIDVATKIGRGDFTARIEHEALRGDAHRLGGALNQMVVRLAHASGERAESEARLRRFVADASHELRTPLTSIRGYAQLCRMGAAGDDASVAIARIEGEARRMSTLVDDLLMLARMDQGRSGTRALLDLTSVVAELTLDARVVEPTRRIDFEAPTGPIEVFGNADELRQVVSNLLANVRAHTAPDVPVCVTVQATESEATVVVRDSGPGMREADAVSAFDRFFRVDTSRSRQSGGSGLGLSIAQTIVDAHGGTIDIESRLGEGTTVCVRLPRAVGRRLTSGDAAPMSAQPDRRTTRRRDGLRPA